MAEIRNHWNKDQEVWTYLYMILDMETVKITKQKDSRIYYIKILQ